MPICKPIPASECVTCGDVRPIDTANMALVLWLDSRDYASYILSAESNVLGVPSYHYVTNGLQMMELCGIGHAQEVLGSAVGASWPLFNPALGPNGQTIHVGMFGDAYVDPKEATKSLCCLMHSLGMTVDALHIITPYDINTGITSGLTSLPDGLIEDIQACIESPDESELVDIYACCEKVAELVEDVDVLQIVQDELALDVATLTDCCNTNSSDIANLQADVLANTTSINILNTQVTAIQAQLIEIMRTLVGIQECVDEVCGPNESTCAHYQMLGQMQIPPNVPTWLNFAALIEDASPPIVLAGPMWAASLTGECAWTIEGTVRFAVSDWCVGEEAELWLVACGNRYLLDSHTVTTTSGSVTLSGNFILNTPPDCTDVHLEIYHNSIDAPFKVVEYGNIQVCCG